MKKLFVILLFTVSYHIASAQHYGGIYVAPTWTKNNSYFNSSQIDAKDFTFGYSVGYQGLIMPKRRFSFSYGLQYAYYFIEDNLKNENRSATTFKNIIGRKVEYRIMQIPATWRYNILKDNKFQPYISASTTLMIPLSHKIYTINEDGEKELFLSFQNKIVISPDIGVGVNYTKNNWIFNIQGSVRPLWEQFGVGFSVMKKF